MTSTIGISSPLIVEFSNQNYTSLIKTNEGDQGVWHLALGLVRLFVCIVILAFLMLMISLIFKLLGNSDVEATTEQMTATETNRLLPKDATPSTYGTCDEDLESGNYSSSSSDDLYDGKICVICYDGPRNSFFVPCGHCATCYVCANRIIEGEKKACPVCRRFIHKVRKLFAS